MASIYPQQVINLYTTPAELRRLADLMDEFWANRPPLGSNLTVTALQDTDVEIRIICDQEKMDLPYEKRESQLLPLTGYRLLFPNESPKYGDYHWNGFGWQEFKVVYPGYHREKEKWCRKI